MTPISADELMFDEDVPVGGMKAVSADDLEFDSPGQLPKGLAFKTWQDLKDWKPNGGFGSAKELATWLKIRNASKEFGDPDRPFETVEEFNSWLTKPRTKKGKPAQPRLKSLGELRERARTFKPLQDPAPGYELALEQEPGGIVLQFPKGDSFKAEGMTVGQRAPGTIKPRLVGVRREDGESAESFRKRAEAWSQSEKARKEQERAELAQVRARTTPSRGPVDRAAEGFKTGLGEMIRTTGVGISLLTGQEPNAVALEQPLPTMNEQDSQGWMSKGGQGLGSMVGFMMASPLLGSTGVMLIGAAQNAGQTYEEARARGVSHDEALAAAVPGALIGALEGIGGGGGAATGFIKGTIGEAGQEGLSQVLNNINAKFISGYDPQRAITEGVMESAVLGGLLGAGVHGVGAALTGHPAVVPTVPTSPQLQGIPKANSSFISSPTESQANLEAQSPAEIDQLDRGKLDPNALHGPGFYMTQDPEVATGNEGTFAKDDSRLSASFTSDQLLEMEVRAAQAGRPVALRPVTVQSFHQQIGAINQELMRVDPASPEFARLADRAVQLRRAVEEAPTPADLKDGKSMREWARKQNMWHDTAAQDLLNLLGITDESGADVSLPGIKADWALYHKRVKSGDRGARFYPLPIDNGKGGTIFLSPQSMVDAGVIQPEEVGYIGGMNVPVETAVDYARIAELGGHADVAGAIRGAIAEAQQKGLLKVALAMYVPGQGLAKTKQFVRHESFHTGQQVAAKASEVLETDTWSNPMQLTSQELLYHPIVAKVAKTEGGQSVLAYYDGDTSALAFEMAAYAAAGQTTELGWTKEEADGYLADYLMDVLETSGVEALEGLARGARLSAPVAQQVAKLTEDHYGRERQRRDRANSFAASLRAPSATVGPEGKAGGSSEEGSRVGKGGAGTPAIEGQVDGVSEEPTRDYGELDADDLEWDEDDLVDPVEQQLREVYEAATQDVPPTPPTAPTPTEGGKPGSPLTETVVAKDRYAQLRQKLMQAAVAKGYKWDLSIPPGLQLAKAIKAGYLDMDNMTETLARAGMTVTDLADLAEFTQHRAGQILNELSKITKELDDLISTNPQLASLIIGPNKVMQRGLKKLEATELGHSIWERQGSIMRKNFLSRLSTAFTQVWSTTAQIPLDIASGAIAGLGMRFLNPAKWQHNSTGMFATVKEDVVRGIEPVLALARGMNPAQIADLLKWQKPAKQMEYKKIVDDLSLIYPEIYGKLHGREDIMPGSNGYTSPAALRQVLTQVKDPALKREYEVKLRTLEGRERFNKSLPGKVLKGYENALDVILMPLSVQEYAFRRPTFVGALQRELEARGLDLNDFIANPKKVAGARDILQAAVDDALRFTWAYEPKVGNKAVGQTEQALEGAAHYFVRFWNKLGPIGATLEAFPRALTNGLKFAYEWSPFGFLSPAWQVQDKMRHGARDQITFQESQRMAQAVVGTMMYGIALGLREWAGGEEWWQLKTGKKDKNGKPVYYDTRRIPQLAFFLNAADLAKRASEDTLGDIKVEQRLKDTYLGARRNSQPGDLGAIDQFMLMWAGDTVPTNAKQKSKLAAGQWASTFVIPLSNIRDAWAQFSMEEGAKRDLRESPWLGPSLDKLPWLRRKLPLAEGPFEPSPQLGAYAPLAEGESLGPVTGAFALGGAIGATRMTPGQSFAAREFARLGLSPYTWLKRDPSPAIDRAQWARMSTILQAVGNSLANNPSYLSQSSDQQRAIWEEIIGGPEGAAAEAKAAGLESNPQEAERRKTLQAVPPYRRKAIGLDKMLPAVGQR